MPSLLKNILLLLVYVFFSSFIDSCLFCGRNDTDIGRGSSVSVKPSHFLFLLLFLLSLISLPFLRQCFFFSFFLFLLRSLFPFCNSCFFSPLFCLICFFFQIFLPSFLKTLFVFSSSSLISYCFSVLL